MEWFVIDCWDWFLLAGRACTVRIRYHLRLEQCKYGRGNKGTVVVGLLLSHLHAGAYKHAEEHGHLDGGSEHVGVHELPPRLLTLLHLLLVSHHLAQGRGEGETIRG